MPYLVNIYFQGKIANGSGEIFPSENDAISYAQITIKNIIFKYQGSNKSWLQSCYSYVITPEDQILFPNYKLVNN